MSKEDKLEFKIVEVENEEKTNKEDEEESNVEYLVEDPSEAELSDEQDEEREDRHNYDYKINLTKSSRTPLSEEYYNETHILKNTNRKQLLKSILISKWPQVGFGFRLNKNLDKDLFQINSILNESPAESCLSVGDLILQLDNESTKKFENTRDIEFYLQDKDSVYLLTLNESNYSHFKSLNLSLQNYSNISEDIVVVTWNQLKQTSND